MNWLTWSFSIVTFLCVAGFISYIVVQAYEVEKMWTALAVQDVGSIKYAPVKLQQNIDTENFKACLRNACYQLNLHGAFKDDYVYGALAGVKILVNDTPLFKGHDTGESVAGEAYVETNTLKIGSDFAALCHEIGHLIEYRKTGIIDGAHVGWTKNGFLTAIDAYAAWRSGRP